MQSSRLLGCWKMYCSIFHSFFHSFFKISRGSGSQFSFFGSFFTLFLMVYVYKNEKKMNQKWELWAPLLHMAWLHNVLTVADKQTHQIWVINFSQISWSPKTQECQGNGVKCLVYTPASHLHEHIFWNHPYKDFQSPKYWCMWKVALKSWKIHFWTPFNKSCLIWKDLEYWLSCFLRKKMNKCVGNRVSQDPTNPFLTQDQSLTWWNNTIWVQNLCLR